MPERTEPTGCDDFHDHWVDDDGECHEHWCPECEEAERTYCQVEP